MRKKCSKCNKNVREQNLLQIKQKIFQIEQKIFQIEQKIFQMVQKMFSNKNRVQNDMIIV